MSIMLGEKSVLSVMVLHKGSARALRWVHSLRGSYKSRISLAIMFAFITLVFWTLYNTPTDDDLPSLRIDTVSKIYELQRPKQVLIRTAPVNQAGMGAVMAQLRQSVAVAAMLGADFTTYSLPSEHAYEVASYMSFDAISVDLSRGAKVCSLTSRLRSEHISALVSDWCHSAADPDGSEASEMQEAVKDCGIILDDTPPNVRLDLWQCTRPWTRKVIQKSLAKQAGRPAFPAKNVTGIGLHIRWGDMANGNFKGDTRTPQRSTPISVAARILRKLRRCGIRDELKVYMEAHNSSMLVGLNQPFRIVDSGDDLADLADLASNRVMILAHGSYSYLAHQITDGRLTVVPDTDLSPNRGWRFSDNGVSTVMRWREVADIPCADLMHML